MRRILGLLASVLLLGVLIAPAASAQDSSSTSTSTSTSTSLPGDTGVPAPPESESESAPLDIPPPTTEVPPVPTTLPELETNIVGGNQSSTGQFPWTAGLIRRGFSRKTGFKCGASVISRSWLLTAGHCVLDYFDQYPDSVYGNYVAPNYYDALTGINSLAENGGGQRLQVAAIYPHPFYNPFSNDNDVALIRLARPTSAPAIEVIGTTPSELALDNAGMTATAVGWGTLYSGAGTIPTFQRYVNVPVQSNATCGGAYYPGFRDQGGNLLEYRGANMLCAGPMSGGQDSCQGDSGGPLAVQAPDLSWRQIGVVSFGYRCAEPGFPGVYNRLASSAGWIGFTPRYGPFNPDGFAFVQQQYRDFTGKDPSMSQYAKWLTTLQSTFPAEFVAALQASGTWDQNADMNIRLYRAAFGRNPETGGLDFWVRRRWAGRGPVSIANHFTASSEFINTYGNLSNDEFVTLIYQNVFERDPDPGGRAYWNAKLARGVGRGQMLYELSNSSEYRRDTDTEVRIISTRFALIRQAPSSAEITASETLTQTQLIDSMRLSNRYASRFNG